MKFLISLILVSFTLAVKGQMVTEWFVKMNETDLPATYTPATIPAMLLPKQQKGTTYLPASLDNAVDSLAIVAIGALLKDSIDDRHLVQDFRIDTLLDSKGQIIITDISREYDTFKVGKKRDQYKVANPVFLVSWTFRWRKDP